MYACCPGSVSDIEIFRRNEDRHKECSNKQVNEFNFSEKVDLNENHPSYILCDKGYTGLTGMFRMVMPDKTPANGWLTIKLNVCNRRISSDRFLV